MNRNSAKSATEIVTEVLVSNLKKRSVVTLSELRKFLNASRRTVFRTLKSVGCLSSYSHAGKFYTLATIPNFDSYGVWFHRDIGFSKYGTLRATIVVTVNEAIAGCSHEELQAILQLKVHDTLYDLFRDQLIGREQINAMYIYFTTDSKRAKVQIAKRQAMMALPPVVPVNDRPLNMAGVVEILLIVIRKQKASIPQIRSMLGAKGIIVSDREVERVLDRYDLKKKIKNYPSKHSRK